MAVALGAVALAGVLPTGPLGAQRCREPHYRWTQKVDTSLATLAPQPASAVAMLGTWEPPHLGAQDRCAPRAGRELQVYRLTGDRKSTRLNSSHGYISYAVFCLKKKKKVT